MPAWFLGDGSPTFGVHGVINGWGHGGNPWSFGLPALPAFLGQAGTEAAPAAPAAAPAIDMNFWAIITHSGPVVFGVLILLVLMAVACTVIIVKKVLEIRRATGYSIQFLEMFWNTNSLNAAYDYCGKHPESPLGEVFRAGYQEMARLRRGWDKDVQEGREPDKEGDLESVDRALRKAHTTQMAELESFTPFLATTASAAPFIGLFGTVWGIMTSFIDIGAKGNATLATVAPGIAEALIATAMGLVAAIPAVIAYNYLSAQIRVLDLEMENFSRDFLNLVKRNFFR